MFSRLSIVRRASQVAKNTRKMSGHSQEQMASEIALWQKFTAGQIYLFNLIDQIVYFIN